MQTDKQWNRFALAGACAVSLLAGCSSPPVPREQLAVGQSSLDAAQSAGAAELAPVELNKAREKLSLAIAALQDKQYVAARRLAEEADVDAQVARSRATAERSRKAAQEVIVGLQTLKQQLDRAGNDEKLMPTAPAAGPATGPGTSQGATPRGVPKDPGSSDEAPRVQPSSPSGQDGQSGQNIPNGSGGPGDLPNKR